MKIKKLTPKLLNAWLHYFDNVAYEKDDQWQSCYCMHFHWDEPLIQRGKIELPKNSRPYAIEYINEGKLQGYVAMQNDEVIGWCNANDKQAYACDVHKYDLDEDNKVKSVVCFNIAPTMRRHGIASMLLEKVCEDAAAEGYDYIEAYPFSISEHRDYHGPLSLYEKNGFTVHEVLDGITVVRKYLQK